MSALEIVKLVDADIGARIEAIEGRSQWRFGNGCLIVSSGRIVAVGHTLAVPTTRSSDKARSKLSGSPATSATNRSSASWLPDAESDGIELADVLCPRRRPTSLSTWRSTDKEARRGAVKSRSVGNTVASQLYVDSTRRGAWSQLLALHSFVGIDLGKLSRRCCLLLAPNPMAHQL